MSTTAKALAAKLNLSAAAVSMALHNKPGVSTQTRQAVMDAALKYGYDFSKITEKKVTEGISMECKRQKYKLKISYLYEEEDTLEKQIGDIQYSDCIGLLLLGTEMNPEDLKPFLKLPIPLVLLDAYFDALPCDCVLINNHQGAYLAAFPPPKPSLTACPFRGWSLLRHVGNSPFRRSSGFLLFCRQ